MTGLTWQGLPLLALAFHMLKPAAGGSKGSGGGTAQGAASRTCTGSVDGSAEAGSRGADRAQMSQCGGSSSRSGGSGGMHKQPGGSSSSHTASGRVGPSLLEAWTQSAGTLTTFALSCVNLCWAKTCMLRVRRHQIGVLEYSIWSGQCSRLQCTCVDHLVYNCSTRCVPSASKTCVGL
jgi:hypothetical protein